MLKGTTAFVLAVLLLPYSTHVPALETEADSAIDAKAVEVMENVSGFLNTFDEMTMHAEGTVEKVFLNGQKLQFTNSGAVYLRRPDHMRVNVKGDLLDQEYYYNGKRITLYGKGLGFYASMENVPDTVTAAFDYAAERFGLNAPFADFFARDLYQVVKEEAFSGAYLGLSTVRGIECHHLAFRQNDADWQIWVETGKRPFPRKLVITETWVTGAPQFTVEMVRWDVTTRLEDSLFEFIPPNDAEKIDFLPLTAVEIN